MTPRLNAREMFLPPAKDVCGFPAEQDSVHHAAEQHDEIGSLISYQYPAHYKSFIL
jgi:hypothetical protein